MGMSGTLRKPTCMYFLYLKPLFCMHTIGVNISVWKRKLVLLLLTYCFGNMLIMATHNGRNHFIPNYSFASPSTHKLFTSWRFCWIVSSHFKSAYLMHFGISVILSFSGYFAGSYACWQQKFPAKTLTVRCRQRSVSILHSINYIL